MLNKLKFNNLVISNKKGIQQSRIQTINKLVHKVRKLKTLLEKHPENLKCKERIRKSTETMELLKKLKRMDIMKNMLLMEKPGPAIITNGLSTPEEIAVALLSMNKIMQVLIKRFKTELGICEAKNDDWKQVLMESSKRKRKIERTEEKRKQRLAGKQLKAIDRKRQEWLEENHINTRDDLSLDADVNISTIGNWQVDDLSNDKATEDDKVVKKSITATKEKTETKPLAKQNKKRKSENVQVLKSAESFLLEEKRQSGQLCGLIQSTNIPEINQNVNTYEKEESKETLVFDPFFITDTGENYLSTAFSKNESITEEENMDLHMIKLNNLSKNRFDRRNQKRQQNGGKWKNERDQQNNKNDKSRQNQWDEKNDFQKRMQDPNKTRSDNNDKRNMHPSWAAKQKFKPVITAFQGSKITFGDDLSQKDSRLENDIKNRKLDSTKVNNPEKDSLHPSWLAKQKLKPTITAFQGKKITFDIDD